MTPAKVKEHPSKTARNNAIVEMYYERCDSLGRHQGDAHSTRAIAEKFGLAHQNVKRILENRKVKPRLRVRVAKIQPKRKLTVAEKFWAKVLPPDANGCRLWKGSITETNPYGRFFYSVTQENISPSRAAWILTNGPVPTYHNSNKTLSINHVRNCPHKHCCEPTHLYAGTQKENIADYFSVHPEGRPRYMRGTKTIALGCTSAISDECIVLRRDGWTLQQLGNRYCVTRQAIWDWLRRKGYGGEGRARTAMRS